VFFPFEKPHQPVSRLFNEKRKNEKEKKKKRWRVARNRKSIVLFVVLRDVESVRVQDRTSRVQASDKNLLLRARKERLYGVCKKVSHWGPNKNK
jgi:hypothetical protein